MIPDLSGKTINAMQSDYALKLWTTDGWRILLAGDTTFASVDGETVVLDTEVASLEPIAEAKPLLGSSITGASASPTGDLEITLDAGRLLVRAGESYEAWQLDGPHGELVICMPGGELAVWGPRGV